MRDKPSPNGPIFTEPPTHHPVYYREGVIILVENTLFKVPRCTFEHNSPVLADILSLSSGGKEAGLMDDAPVYLEQVTATDFERLLVIFCPLITSEDYPSASWTAAEWASILRLATRWDMTRIRSMAIKNLDKLASPARKISLGRKYDHPTWIPEGFMTLCLQPDFLTEDEAGELELKDIVGCATARERIRAKVMDVAPGTSVFSSTRLGNSRARIGIYEDGIKYMGNPVVRDIVENIFGIETSSPS